MVQHDMAWDNMIYITSTQLGGMVQHDMAWGHMTHIIQHDGMVHHGMGPHGTYHTA
jgi:hypothetical protein